MKFRKVSYRCSLLYFIALLSSVLSCKTEVRTEQELLSFVSEPSNGLSKKVHKGSVSLEVVCRPKDLVILQEISGQNYSEKQLDSIREKFDALDYFLMRMSRNDQEVLNAYVHDPAKFNKASNYLSFEIGNDLVLINENDTFPVEGFIHTNTFGFSTSSDIMFAFRSGLLKRKGKFYIQFNDNAFGTGLTVFEFEVQKIKDIPSLDLNQIES